MRDRDDTCGPREKARGSRQVSPGCRGETRRSGSRFPACAGPATFDPFGLGFELPVAAWRHPHAPADAGINLQQFVEVAHIAERSACSTHLLFFEEQAKGAADGSNYMPELLRPPSTICVPMVAPELQAAGSLPDAVRGTHLRDNLGLPFAQRRFHA